MVLVAKQSLVNIYMRYGNNHDHRPVSVRVHHLPHKIKNVVISSLPFFLVVRLATKMASVKF